MRKIIPPEKKDNPDCQLKRWPDGSYWCCTDPSQCIRCGWSPKVAAERKEKLYQKWAQA